MFDVLPANLLNRNPLGFSFLPPTLSPGKWLSNPNRSVKRKIRAFVARSGVRAKAPYRRHSLPSRTRPERLWRQTAPQTHPCKKKGIGYEFKT